MHILVIKAETKEKFFQSGVRHQKQIELNSWNVTWPKCHMILGSSAYSSQKGRPLCLVHPQDFVDLSSLCGNGICMLMQLGFYSGSFLMYFYLSEDQSPRLVRYAEVELVMKPWHSTSTGNLFVIPVTSDTLFSQIFILFYLMLMCLVYIFLTRTVN